MMKLKDRKEPKSFRPRGCGITRKGKLLRVRGTCPGCGAKVRMYHVGIRWFVTRGDAHGPGCAEVKYQDKLTA